ncbi:MAG: hypothetical protein KAZ87_05515 [Spirochaetes bacterium]|nr:hypothetical protein [Spirochaetota bacterium]
MKILNKIPEKVIIDKTKADRIVVCRNVKMAFTSTEVVKMKRKEYGKVSTILKFPDCSMAILKSDKEAIENQTETEFEEINYRNYFPECMMQKPRSIGRLLIMNLIDKEKSKKLIEMLFQKRVLLTKCSGELYCFDYMSLSGISFYMSQNKVCIQAIEKNSKTSFSILYYAKQTPVSWEKVIGRYRGIN